MNEVRNVTNRAGAGGGREVRALEGAQDLKKKRLQRFPVKRWQLLF